MPRDVLCRTCLMSAARPGLSTAVAASAHASAGTRNVPFLVTSSCCQPGYTVHKRPPSGAAHTSPGVVARHRASSRHNTLKQQPERKSWNHIEHRTRSNIGPTPPLYTCSGRCVTAQAALQRFACPHPSSIACMHGIHACIMNAAPSPVIDGLHAFLVSSAWCHPSCAAVPACAAWSLCHMHGVTSGSEPHVLRRIDHGSNPGRRDCRGCSASTPS